FAAVSLYWWVAVRNLEHGYADWEAAARSAGWSTRHGPPVRGGWPLAATLALPSLSFAHGGVDVPEAMSWIADGVVLRVGRAWPRNLDATAEGRLHLRAPGVARVSYGADLFRLELPLLAGAWPGFIDLRVENLRADIPNAGGGGAQSLRLHTDS